jgi:hypothetical protein
VSASAFADTSCLPDFTSAQILERIDPVTPKTFVYPLKTRRSGFMLETEAVLEAHLTEGVLQMTVHFSDDFHGVSLPYNLYLVGVTVNGEPVNWQDLTGACEGPGAGIFPGQSIDLKPVKVHSQGILQIVVWGRL